MSRTEFFRKIADILKPEDVQQVAWAYWLAKEVHRTQKRDDGERYFEHCRRVSLLAIEYGCNRADSIIIALLHDALEDSFITPAVIRKLFGAEVEGALRALSKTETSFYEHDGSIRKTKKDLEGYFLEIKNNPKINVRVIKCADRLDNLQNLSAWSRARRLRYVVETRKYLMPIALSVSKRGKLYCDLKSAIDGVLN